MKNTKKIIASLAMIIIVGASAVTATKAYFSSSVVSGSNTFTTGTVTIGQSTGLPLNVSGIGPGITLSPILVSLGYSGSLNADLWLGVTGTSKPGDPTYMGDILKVKVHDTDTNTDIYDGLVSGLSTAWHQIGANLAQNSTKHLSLTFYMDSSVNDNSRQGHTNSDTVLQFYAVQTGGAAPTVAPYLQTSTTSFQ